MIRINNKNSKSRYKRILLKLSGESFLGKGKESINFDFIKKVAGDIKKIKNLGYNLGIVVGGGNIIRGRDSKEYSINQEDVDKMGMIATFINAISLSAILNKFNIKNKVLNIFEMGIYGERYNIKAANKYFKDGLVLIFAGGTGKVGVTNDTNSALRAKETNCDVILKATNVDGVYNKDPRKYKNAIKYNSLTFQEAIDQKLQVMDQKAFEICRKSKIPIVVFNLHKKDNLKKAILGKDIGTMVE